MAVEITHEEWLAAFEAATAQSQDAGGLTVGELTAVWRCSVETTRQRLRLLFQKHLAEFAGNFPRPCIDGRERHSPTYRLKKAAPCSKSPTSEVGQSSPPSTAKQPKPKRGAGRDAKARSASR